jgi:4-hydroxy-tetrahydrodipicolinate synthase
VRGVIGACLTPFTANGRVDYPALQAEIEFMVPDVQAIAVAAVEAAEYTVLSLSDRKELLRTATEMVGGRVPVILGVSGPAVPDVVALAHYAAESGADAVQVLMPARPWGGQPSAEELVTYFSQVADAVSLPIVAYHNPAAGADPPVSAWIELADLPGIAYFKESSRDIAKISRLVEHIDLAGRAAYFTTMQPMLVTLLLGGSGATMPPPATRIAARVLAAVERGDIASAACWQRFFSVFPATWSSYGLVPVMKAAMRHFGVDIGVPAPPYMALLPEHDRQLGRFLRASGVLDGGTVSAQRLTAAIAELGPR